jgi:hypothetical protein
MLHVTLTLYIMRNMITRKRMRWFGVAALILASLYAAITLIPWSGDMCGEENIGEAYSSDGKYLARAYVRSCGATTGWETHVNLRSRWSYFNPTWDGIINQGQVFSVSGRSNVSVVWRDNSNLEIQCPTCTPHENGKEHATWELDSWEGINISYRRVEIK